MTTHRAPADPVGADLLRLLKTLKLGALADTLPETRRAGPPAQTQPHRVPRNAAGRRGIQTRIPFSGTTSGQSRTRPDNAFRHRTAQDDLRYDRTLLGDLTSLRFLDAGQSAICSARRRRQDASRNSIGTHGNSLQTHRLVRRADKLFTRLRAARLDNTVDAEIRRLAAIDVLIIDDFALRPLDATETSDFYEIIVERHRAKTTIVTSNREPAEWLTMTADTLLAQSAIDRLTAAAHTLVIEGPSYRQRTRGRPA